MRPGGRVGLRIITQQLCPYSKPTPCILCLPFPPSSQISPTMKKFIHSLKQIFCRSSRGGYSSSRIAKREIEPPTSPASFTRPERLRKKIFRRSPREGHNPTKVAKRVSESLNLSPSLTLHEQWYKKLFRRSPKEGYNSTKITKREIEPLNWPPSLTHPETPAIDTQTRSIPQEPDAHLCQTDLSTSNPSEYPLPMSLQFCESNDIS